MAVTKRKRKSKGKRHTVHAESFDNIAHAIDDIVRGEPLEAPVTVYDVRRLAGVFKLEAKRVRGILR